MPAFSGASVFFSSSNEEVVVPETRRAQTFPFRSTAVRNVAHKGSVGEVANGCARPSCLLRRSHRSSFEMTDGADTGSLRLRRTRRVSGSFNAIPDLARDGTR